MRFHFWFGVLSLLLAASGCARPVAAPPSVRPPPANVIVAEEQAQPEPEAEPQEETKIETLEAAGYVVTWERPPMPATCRLKITRDSRVVRQFTFEGWVRAHAFEPSKGLPHRLVINYFSGGAHCCTTLYLYALAPRFRHLATFYAGNYDLREEKDVNGDGAKDLVCGDDSFAYFHCCHAESPGLPYVLVYRRGRYVDGTSECRWLLREQMAANKQALEKPPGEPDSWSYSDGANTNQERQAHIVEYYCLSKLLGEGKQAREWLQANLDPDHRKWFVGHRHEMDERLAARPDKLTYQEPQS